MSISVHAIDDDDGAYCDSIARPFIRVPVLRPSGTKHFKWESNDSFIPVLDVFMATCIIIIIISEYLYNHVCILLIILSLYNHRV